MGKIYVNDDNVSEKISELGLDVYKEVYLDERELEEYMSNVIDNILDMDIVNELSNMGIHLHISYELDKTIYNDEY